MPEFGSRDRRRPAVLKEAGIWFARMRGPDSHALRPEFERWRNAVPAHREAYEQAGEQWLEAGRLTRTEMGRIRRLPERRPSIWQMPAARSAFAAIALLLAAVVGFWSLRAPGGTPDHAVVAEPQTSKVGEIRTVKLTDGSTVTLDTDSAIEFRLFSNLREARLVRGRARFDVAHDASRPFRVEAAGRTVTALGTIFDVGFEPGGLRVSLVRGAVDVRGATLAGGVAMVARLVPGECFVEMARRARVAKASPGSQQWVSGMLDFDSVPLGDVIEQTNRYSLRKIRLRDSSLAARRVTGSFRPLPIDDLAAALSAAFALRVEQSPQGDLILRRPRRKVTSA